MILRALLWFSLVLIFGACGEVPVRFPSPDAADDGGVDLGGFIPLDMPEDLDARDQGIKPAQDMREPLDMGMMMPQARALEAPDYVTLPAISVGAGAEPARVLIRVSDGELSLDELSLEVSGPFEIVGEPALEGAGALAVELRYSGAVSAPTLADGALTVRLGELAHQARLSAVVARAGLPQASWRAVDGGQVAIVRLPSAPFPHSSGPWTDDAVMLVIPDGLTLEDGVDVMLHLHGHRAELERTEASQHLARMFLASGRDAVLVIPQGPVNAASGNFGKLMVAGGLEALLKDVLAILYQDRRVALARLGRVVVSAHSGGYLAAARLLTLGEIELDAIYLLDALYGQLDVFERFAARPGKVFRSNHTSSGGTRQNNLGTLSRLGAAGLSVDTRGDDGALRRSKSSVIPSDFSHNDCIWSERTLARWLQAGPLKPHALAPPELLAVTGDAATGQAKLRWAPYLHSASIVIVEGAARLDEAPRFEDLGAFAATSQEAEVSLSDALRLSAARERPITEDGVSWRLTLTRSAPSDTYGARSPGAPSQRWLIVDGFDRLVGSSYRGFTHDFGAHYLSALSAPAGADTCSNEALAQGLVDPLAYDGILWFLGDESTTDHTFEPAERAFLDQVIAQGIPVILTGAELGYATDKAWLSQRFGVSYVADNAMTQTAGGLSFGQRYPEDYPDVLSGPEVLWRYEPSGAGAAVGRAGRFVLVGFALETMSQATLTQALGQLVSWVKP